MYRHESLAIKKIVDEIQVTLLSDVAEDLGDENLVGMSARLQDLESLLDIKSDVVVRMVGIWGVGGIGKTTLATSLCIKVSRHFHGHCVVENVREQSRKYDLKKLQEDILLAISDKVVKVQSVAEGKCKIKHVLRRRKVLLVLDDVDQLDQLEALGGSHEWFCSGSRIIITTRDKQLLETHKVDDIYPIRLLAHDEAIQLFNRHAYNEKKLVKNYKTLSFNVVSYANGLPLALKVLGSFLYDKDEKEWMSTLLRLKDIPEVGIMETLKISYDGLKDVEKQLFLDIACFFIGKNEHDAMGIFEACNFLPKIGIKVLRQKALITIVEGRFNMHDLVQEMGHHIVRGEHPYNPGKHSRVWKDREINNMCFEDAAMEYDKIEAIRYDSYSYDQSSRFCKIISNMKKLRYLSVGSVDDPYYFSERDEYTRILHVHDHSSCYSMYNEGPTFLSNELMYIDWKGYHAKSPFPESFQPKKLVVLTLENSLQKVLWKGFKHLPHLKVLMLIGMKELLITPSFDGLPCLQKLRLDDCYVLEEIHPSLGNHSSLEHTNICDRDKLRRFPAIVQMVKLKTLELEYNYMEDGGIPSGIGELLNLQELNLSGNDFSRLDFSLSQLTRLKLLNVSDCINLLEFPELPSSLNILKADNCLSLTTFGHCYKNCKWLREVSLIEGGFISDGGRLLESMLQPFGVGSCVQISIEHSTSGMNSQHEVVWEESDSEKSTWVGYVSFESLRHTNWWNQTFKALSFKIYANSIRCRGFGVRLVDKKSRKSTSEDSNPSSDYTPKFKIPELDSSSSYTPNFKVGKAIHELLTYTLARLIRQWLARTPNETKSIFGWNYERFPGLVRGSKIEEILHGRLPKCRYHDHVVLDRNQDHVGVPEAVYLSQGTMKNQGGHVDGVREEEGVSHVEKKVGMLVTQGEWRQESCHMAEKRGKGYICTAQVDPSVVGVCSRWLVGLMRDCQRQQQRDCERW
ncbi:hypothetical protein E3N88_22790 [Mikania micrantha]|uniref:Uncharacterized protein n=1 Tax=Mikania micrantha TaxID=192012 RepID=A0A5N6NCH6_9ASTR|nr:hypothetical protein E3N88_22790 [Mikania micrantha]